MFAGNIDESAERVRRTDVVDRIHLIVTVAQHVEYVKHHSVSAHTIRRRLQHSGLSAKHPMLGLPLTQNHGHLFR
ncbi:hypothetical protein TNCV_3823041 [Trichonephila clavipes]|nr:hypothetical protein TNCV_3823041 [Trichonephila clavipes]